MKIRSSAFAAFKRCPRFYYYAYLLGLSSKKKPKTNDLYFGTKLHKAIELYHKKDFNAGLLVWDEYDNEFSGEDKNPVVGRILYEKYVEDPLDLVCTEREFTIHIGSHKWGGRFDGIANVNGLLYVVDHKTTRWEFRQTKPNDQFVSYYLGGKVFYHDVNGLIVNEFNVRTKSINRIIVSYHPDEVIDWIDETKAVISYMVRCTNTGIFPKTPDCFKYNRECKYRMLCNSSNIMARRLIESQFVVNKQQKELSY